MKTEATPNASTPKVTQQNRRTINVPLKRRTTIHDVAKQAGVAPSTVSNFLNNKGRMNDSTRVRIQEAMNMLHYTPNAMTQAIRKRHTRILGIVAFGIWDFDNGIGMSIIPPILAGINKTAQLAGYDVLMYTNWFTTEHYSGIRFLNGNIDGLISMGALVNETIMEQTAEAGLPITALLTRHVPASVGYINADNINSMHKIVEHLISIGRKRIGFFSTTHDSNHIDRYQGFCDAMKKAGLEWDNAPLKYSIRPGEDWKDEKVERGLKCLLEMADTLDAIVVPNDHWAIWIIEDLRRLGYKVPDDIAVVGFNDVPDAKLEAGGITTIRQPFHQIGQLAVERLLALIEGAPVSECRVTLPTELIVRASTVIVRG